MEKLDGIFKRFYPLFVRRAEFWNYKQKQGQKYSEALAIYRCIGDECDITTMTGEEVICIKMITLCTDEELKVELMKPELPTIPGLMTIVHQYEAVQVGQCALQDAQQANTKSTGAEGPGNLSRKKTRTGHVRVVASRAIPETNIHIRTQFAESAESRGTSSLVCEANEEKRKAYADKQRSPSMPPTQREMMPYCNKYCAQFSDVIKDMLNGLPMTGPPMDIQFVRSQ